MWGYVRNYVCNFFQSEQQRANENEFISRFQPPVKAHEVEPNHLAITTRAINRIRNVRTVFQPRWKSTRFKAKT